MTKKNIIDAITEKQQGASKTQIEKTINLFVAEISEGLLEEQKVKIQGFGTFRKVTVKKRIGINPRTKEKITIPSFITAKFRAGDVFKNAIKN